MVRKTNRNSEIVIRVSGLSNGFHEYNFFAQSKSIGLDGNFQETVEIHSELEKTSRQIYLKTKIITAGQFQCDRCLDNFDQPISTSYSVCYVYNKVDGERFSTEELQVISPDTVSLDLTEDIRQMILLSIPLKLLCSEDCKGLCSQCGANWNHRSCDCKQDEKDPRWQGLQDLLHH